MIGTDYKKGISGYVTFEELANGKTRITAKICGLKDGDHGFHVHTFSGEEADDLGTHFNPTNLPHGIPPNANRYDIYMCVI